MPQQNTLPGLIFIILLGLGLAFAYPSWSAGGYVTGGVIAIIGFIVASIIANSVKIANQWERVVVLRLGRFHMLGPLLHHPDPRHGRLSDRHPCHHQHVQGGKDDDARHRAGRRRRGVVLEGD
jgi:hypothetical protein